MKNEAELRTVDSSIGTSGADAAPRRMTPPPRRAIAAVASKPTKILPTERVATEKQLDVLRAYVAASGPGNNPVTIEEVSKIADVAESTIKMLNSFYCDVGLIQRLEAKAGKFLPSQEVCNFAKIHEWNRETAAHKLAPLLVKTWFCDPLIRKLSFQPIAENEALVILSEKAEAGRDYEPQLRVLLEYLQAAGLIQRENGTIKANKQTMPAASSEHESAAANIPAKEAPTPKAPLISTAFSNAAQGVVNFHVDVKINMDEFQNWSPERISSFFAGIAQVLAAKGAIEKGVSKENQT